jgi:NADH:ubiquinone oxidoreductase subunit 6 (subunit J)
LPGTDGAGVRRYLERVRPWLREWWWLALLGLAVQAFWAWRVEHPTYFDAYYYTTNAQRLAAGQGFTQEIIWQYLDQPQGLPAPSHTYWMPLASIVGAAGYQLTGTFRGAQLPFWLMAGLLPLLTYTISWRLFRQRWQARAAALFTMAGGYYTAYWVQPTTFALFAWTGGGSLLALALAQERNRNVYWLLAGIAAGLAHLTRADGILLLGVAFLLWALPLARGRSWHGRRLLLLLAGYLLVMTPWFYRTWRLTGQPLSTVGGETVFLTVYDDVFAYGRTFSLEQYLSWGWRNILTSKLEAVWLAVQTYIAVVGLVVLGFLSALVWIVVHRRQPNTSETAALAQELSRRRRFLRPFTWYGILLFVAMSLVFTFPGQRGSLLHSSSALFPWAMALAPAGLDVAVEWIAARRRRWRPAQARRFFAVAFVFMAFAISVAVASGQPLRRDEAAIYREIGELLPPAAVVMASDPPGLHYHSGLRAIATPNEPPAVLLEVACRYGATYLLLDAGHPVPLTDLYEGRDRSIQMELVREFSPDVRLYRLNEVQG